MRTSPLIPLLLLVAPCRGESQEPRQGGAWHVTDQPSITLELEALNVVRGRIVTARPVLYLRCLDEKLEAFVVTGAVGRRDQDYRTTVRLRWADGPPLEETWSRSTDYAAIFAPDPTGLVRHILATPELVLEFQGDEASPIVARFNGAGLANHLPRLRTRCPGSTGASAIETAERVYAETEVDEKAQVSSLPHPEYPPLLRRAHVQGRVVVELVVDKLGRIEPASLRVVSSPHPEFNGPALNAIRRAVFRPAIVRGQPVRSLMRVALVFKDDSP